MSVVMQTWALWCICGSVPYLKTQFDWLDFPENQEWHFRNRSESDYEVDLGLWTLPVIQESIHFIFVVCTARKEHTGTGEDVTDQAQAFEGAFDFDALKSEACCNSLLHWVATFLLNYQEKTITAYKNTETMIFFVLFCEGSEGGRVETFFYIQLLPPQISCKT